MKKVWNISNLVNLAGAARPGCPLFQTDVLPTRVRFWIWCQVSPPDHCWTPISIGVSVLQKLHSLSLLRYIAYFDRADIDGWELRKVCVATQLLIARILLWFDEMSFLSLLTLLATREWVICAQWTWCPNHPLLPLPWGLAGGSTITPSPPGMHRVQMGPHRGVFNFLGPDFQRVWDLYVCTLVDHQTRWHFFLSESWKPSRWSAEISNLRSGPIWCRYKTPPNKPYLGHIVSWNIARNKSPTEVNVSRNEYFTWFKHFCKGRKNQKYSPLATMTVCLDKYKYCSSGAAPYSWWAGSPSARGE